MYRDRLRCKSLLGKVMNAEEAASFIQDGMVVGMSGFTRAGDVKAIPKALAERAKEEPFKITLMTGASTGEDCDSPLTEAGVIARRLPFMSDGKLREAINAGEVMFIDQHLSKTVELLRSRQLPKVDVALLEVLAIEEDGGLVPTTSVGNSASYALFADKILLEINLAQPDALQGVHDIYIPARRPYREPIPIIRHETTPAAAGRNRCHGKRCLGRVSRLRFRHAHDERDRGVGGFCPQQPPVYICYPFNRQGGENILHRPDGGPRRPSRA